MARLLLLFIPILILSSCKKLDSEQVFLKTSCEDCKKEVEQYLLGLKGVYYANFDADNETIVFHFDREDSHLEAKDWLMENGFIQSTDSTVNVYPSCCQVQDSIPLNEE